VTEEAASDEDEGLLATLALPVAPGTDERLDRFLVARLSEIDSGATPRPADVPAEYRLDASRGLVQRWIDDGRVRIGLRALKASTKVRAGETVLVDLPPPTPPPGVLAPEAIDLVLLRQDDDLLVIDKPPGMPVHPGAGRRDGTLANALLHASAGRLSTLGGPERPGIVHRLDMDTSGVIVVARNDRAHRVLSDQFARRLTDKEYVAIVEGEPPDEGTVDQPIGRHPRDRKKMAIVREGGRHAVSHFTVVERFLWKKERFALVRVRIETGRTHQIRVHMAHAGHPVVADATYGRRDSLEDGDTTLIARQALHAARLAFDQPTTGERIVCEAPLPEDMTRTLAALRAK
jgi:23S rRNA pseudouridine1911/1915/1917 synthase